MPKTDKVKVKIRATVSRELDEMITQGIWPKLAESLCEEQDTDRRLS